jgi:radical SAM protein with 4Fe4S-binding SPASM domain
VREVDTAWRPIYAVWEITLRCDLACLHCGSRAGRARPDELTREEALDLVRQMADLGVREVTLIGGEAYLRDDWLDIVRAVRARGMDCNMTTGARGFTRERALAAREAGLTGVSISIDGLRATHDALRALEGSFDAALEGMENARAAGLRLSANTQVNRLSLRELPGILDLLAPRGVTGWQVQITAAMGRAADHPELLLEPFHVLALLPLLASLKPRADAAGVRIFPGNNVGYYGPHEHVLRRDFPGQRRGSCGAGRSTLGIEANGDVKGCPSLPSADYVGGNVRDHALREIWERSAPLRFTRSLEVEDLSGYCRRCYYNEECMGGCSWTAHVLFGKIGDNPFCHHRALELRREGKRERIVQARAAEGLPFDHGRFAIVEEPWAEDDPLTGMGEVTEDPGR